MKISLRMKNYSDPGEREDDEDSEDVNISEEFSPWTSARTTVDPPKKKPPTEGCCPRDHGVASLFCCKYFSQSRVKAQV